MKKFSAFEFGIVFCARDRGWEKVRNEMFTHVFILANAAPCDVIYSTSLTPSLAFRYLGIPIYVLGFFFVHV